MYKKRTGTSGIQGQLYETKLLSLIYFRMMHDDCIEQFNLATNRDDMGAFDDICFKTKINGFVKPVTIFIQAKHRENDKPVTFNKAELAKYFDSYLDIRRAFEPKSKDAIFGGVFEETECFFVIYTTAKGDPNNNIYKSTLAEYLNELIGTGGCVSQLSYKDEDLDFLCKIVIKEQITTLAALLAKFICDECDTELSMNNDIILRYHTILAHKVLDVSEIQPEGHRLANFRQDFFTTNDEFLVLIKNILSLQILKMRKLEDGDKQSLLSKFLIDPSDIMTLSKLIGCVLTYKNDKLEFVSKSMTEDQKRQLDKVNVSQSVIYKAVELAAKDYLLSLKLKVPTFFGNKDLAIRGNDKKIEKRLNYLTTKIIEIFKQSTPNHIVTIDESLGDGFLQLNGGIASAIGNILVYDETSKLFRFTESCESLGSLAKTWYEILKSKIPNLHEYKLDVKVKKFPKLSFERGEYDLYLVKEFYDKLLFFTSQADQKDVEAILRQEIEDHPCSDVKNFRDRSGLIFLKYHDEIQKLWLMPKVGSYLTKKSKIYENAVTYAMNEPLMGVLNKMHSIKNVDYTFNENAIRQFESQGQILGAIIVSDSCLLTVAKVEQFLGNKDHVVLDLEYIFKLPLKSHLSLCKELRNTAKEKILVIVCNNTQDFENSCMRYDENIAKAVNGQQTIIVTNRISIDIMTQCFPRASIVWNDQRSVFTDLTIEAQKKFLKTSKIKFQGKIISLDIIIDDDSVKFIDEVVFNKIINKETVVIGNTVFCDNYETQFYINRRVSRNKKQKHDKFNEFKDKVLTTLYDLEDDLVLITAGPLMGMSTLFTHLSLNTKELYPKVWIVRINFEDYISVFRKRKETYDYKDWKIEYTTLESLKLMCLAAIEKVPDELNEDEEILIELDESPNGTVSLIKCSAGNLTVYQLEMFLHFYNIGKLIFLFDGVYEMIWDNITQAIYLMESVRDYKRRHKIWIATVTYEIDDLIEECGFLEKEFGTAYVLEPFTPLDQDAFFNKFWKNKIQFKRLNTRQLQNVHDYVYFMKNRTDSSCFTAIKKDYLRVYVIFLEFLRTESVACGSDFPFEEYNIVFKRLFDCCDDKSSFLPKDVIAQIPSKIGTTLSRQIHRMADHFLSIIKHVGERDIERDRDPLKSRFCLFQNN